MAMNIGDGGPAFPQLRDTEGMRPIDFGYGGLSCRDWFATFAPEPKVSAINAEGERDRLLNPHGDTYKPQRRSRLEIVSDLRYAYADAMLAARMRKPR